MLALSNAIAFVLATILALHGLRKRSLSPSGAVAAFIVGYFMMAVKLKTFGVSLIAFYLIGSRATKVGKSIKQTLEEGHDSAGGGYRNAWQVFCNSYMAFVCAMAWEAFFVPRSIQAYLMPSSVTSFFIRHRLRLPYEPYAWCALSGSGQFAWSRVLVFGSLAHFACCLGDTLSSELGILSRSPPRLITTFKPVPPGTNGAVSLVGTVVSWLGGALMGFITFISLYTENEACRKGNPSIFLAELVIYGALAGGIGSLIDSLMGATLQQTRYSVTSKKILQDDTVIEGEVKVVSGWNILTNNQINLLSSMLTSFIIAALV
ncbi:hypothetical protein SISSUDRAFT_1004533 [Sistotremastrum suecicum HHB10207 ss-3]|uniref:DUF92-domain-containing protein n=1 Tax=Sistotremastrum suecicum HHB10207 ss-3 TaxID=1314776 RepID=A0A166DM56_9AGAM|nr:hypothetical protein SISSUDRAFT_1004533 [Sistotremastrum suecicum HHB10207 ss-3]